MATPRPPTAVVPCVRAIPKYGAWSFPFREFYPSRGREGVPASFDPSQSFADFFDACQLAVRAAREMARFLNRLSPMIDEELLSRSGSRSSECVGHAEKEGNDATARQRNRENGSVLQRPIGLLLDTASRSTKSCPGRESRERARGKTGRTHSIRIATPGLIQIGKLFLWWIA